MEIMKCVVKGLKADKLTFYLYYIVPFILLILNYTIGLPELSKFNNTVESNYNSGYVLLYYTIPLFIIAVIYIWFYYAPIYNDNIECLQRAFEGNKEYAILYKNYRGWIRQNDLSGKMNIRMVKIAFFLFWFLGTIFFYYCLFKLEILPKSLKVLPLFLLHTITSMLNFSSYYLCISFIF